MISLDQINKDILKEEQLEVAELIGIENYRLLIEYYAGTTIYIPKLSEIERTKRNEQIRCEYLKHRNLKILALKYDLTEVQIRNIVLDLYKSRKEEPLDGQMSIYDI